MFQIIKFVIAAALTAIIVAPIMAQACDCEEASSGDLLSSIRGSETSTSEFRDGDTDDYYDADSAEFGEGITYYLDMDKAELYELCDRIFNVSMAVSVKSCPDLYVEDGDYARVNEDDHSFKEGDLNWNLDSVAAERCPYETVTVEEVSKEVSNGDAYANKLDESEEVKLDLSEGEGNFIVSVIGPSNAEGKKPDPYYFVNGDARNFDEVLEIIKDKESQGTADGRNAGEGEEGWDYTKSEIEFDGSDSHNCDECGEHVSKTLYLDEAKKEELKMAPEGNPLYPKNHEMNKNYEEKKEHGESEPYNVKGFVKDDLKDNLDPDLVKETFKREEDARRSNDDRNKGVPTVFDENISDDSKEDNGKRVITDSDMKPGKGLF